MKCYIMRGLPGSGKSSLAKSLDPMACICSADDSFMMNGAYKFEPGFLGAAHRNCQAKFKALIDVKWPVIVVDNTNTTAQEMRPYVELAYVCGYEVILVEPRTSWAWDVDGLVARNQHGVPRAAIERMLARYQRDLTVEGLLNYDDIRKVG